jgi:hypothetical protein
LGKNQLGLNIRKERDRTGSYFVGLKIRDKSDSSPPLITGNTPVEINISPRFNNTNVINRLWTMIMDKVTDVIVTVMDETIANDKCNDCDGIIEKFPEFKISVESKVRCNTITESDNQEKEISNEFSKMPSQVEQSESRSHTEYEVEEDRDTITAGDKVELEDCPGHWLWASPFTVEAIEGEMVKLEMVSELVKMERLSLL